MQELFVSVTNLDINVELLVSVANLDVGVGQVQQLELWQKGPSGHAGV